MSTLRCRRCKEKSYWAESEYRSSRTGKKDLCSDHFFEEKIEDTIIAWLRKSSDAGKVLSLDNVVTGIERGEHRK